MALFKAERIYLTDAEGRPEQTTEPVVFVTAKTAREAALYFVEREGGGCSELFVRKAALDSPEDSAHSCARPSGFLPANLFV